MQYVVVWGGMAEEGATFNVIITSLTCTSDFVVWLTLFIDQLKEGLHTSVVCGHDSAASAN